MKNKGAALLLLSWASAGLAQPAASIPVRPAYDPPQERQALRSMTACIAAQRPRWARALLAKPYLSPAQASDAALVVSGRDKCLKVPEVSVAFRTSGVVGAVAEQLVRTDLPRTDFKRVSAALATVEPLNASEDLALCVASRNPSAALALATSEPGSSGEAQASAGVGAALPSCVKPEEKLQVDLQSLRALVATALYRGVAAALVPRA